MRLRRAFLSCLLVSLLPAAAIAEDPRWDDRFGFPGVNGLVKAAAWHGGRLYIGGDFTEAGGAPASGLACWDGRRWSDPGPLGTSGTVHPTVNALLSTPQGLVVGGFFTRAAGTEASNLALWDGSSWSALGGGMGNEVHALAEVDGTLFVGGRFKTAGGVPASRIARWDGISWSPLGAGVNNPSDDAAVQDVVRGPPPVPNGHRAPLAGLQVPLDEGLPTNTYYRDADGDGYGNPGNSTTTCMPMPTGYVVNNTDCNDGNALVNPGAAEVCNGVDDNCVDGVDEGFDIDADTFTTCGGDCDDADPSIHPGAVEVCTNGVDDDCNNLTDDADPACQDDTVVITKAAWALKTRKLTVWATSSAAPQAVLTVVGYGTMTYDSDYNRYTLTKNNTSNPGTVTVTSSEGGSDTELVTVQ